MRKFEGQKALLEARRTELARRVARLERELDQPGDPDVEEQAATRQFDEVSERLELDAIEEIQAIDQALGRMDLGEYGLCAVCGEPISAARLRAIPYAVACAPCAA